MVVDGYGLKLEDVREVARRGAEVSVSQEAIDRVAHYRAVVDAAVAAGSVIYGLTTGLGRLCDVVVPAADARDLQRNLILSHSTGVGEPLTPEEVRATLLLRVNALAQGHSGVRPVVIETLLGMLNRRVIPVIPRQGSVGASGDLAPLAHLTLVAIGEGQAWAPDQPPGSPPLPGAEAMRRAGIEPLTLEAKEGLAMTNGTQVLTATLCLALLDALLLLEAATIAASLSLEALRGVPSAFDERVAAVRRHPGQLLVAAKVRELTAGSRYLTRPGELRVQDAYSLRCVPQVHGAVSDVLSWVSGVVEREMNSTTDNPLVFLGADGHSPAGDGGEVLSGGNFHGEPMAFAADFAGIAAAELASMSERRTARLLDPASSAGLPAFLTSRGGLNSGLMLVQYTAAALVSENKLLASPASVDSIPTSAGQEDHVSMGSIAARKARDIVANAARVIAVELLAACQAIDLRGGLEGVAEPGGNPQALAEPLGQGTRRHYLTVRRLVPCVVEDRVLSGDVEKLAAALLRGDFRWT
ncbi:MAG: histidine ammonia-lyase [Bacillota bacterium]|nr:MAG: histidine ammonia-lyase [Bacillota bacterium]